MYILVCNSTMEDVRKLFPIAGSFSVTGFRPSSRYECSLKASNSAGSGPGAEGSLTTMDDCKEWK